MKRQLCPHCAAEYMEWDDEIGQWHCDGCDMDFSDEDVAEVAEVGDLYWRVNEDGSIGGEW